MTKNCIAIDIGASSGRIIMSTLKNEKLELREIHRFENSIYLKDDHYYWDLDSLFNEIIKGLSKIETPIKSIGVDTWGVDYVLLDSQGNKTSDIYAYRDDRTKNSMDKLFKFISKETIYSKTGIQFLPFNTLYQLYIHNITNKEDFKNATNLLLIPDYINYLLSDKITNEFTNATTTQLFNINTKDWDKDLLSTIDINPNLFSNVISPGTIVGELSDKISETTDLFDVKVIAPATHDTGSAIASIPAFDENFAYISSGTWSLMGIESDVPICTEKSLEYNFTNEGGVCNSIRFLKNIMGLWLIQEVKKLYNNAFSFSELVDKAKEATPLKYIINPNNERFLNPSNMIEEIQNYCNETNQGMPTTPGEISRCIFESLAFQYKEVLCQLKELSPKEINKIHIVGGGCQNKFLNHLCADFTGCTVFAGPVEATAIGNLLTQHIALKDIKDLKEGRQIVSQSFDINKYEPNKLIDISESWNKFKQLP